MIKQITCNRPYKRVYLVWCLWLIMKESGSILAARVFVDVKRITEEKV